MPEDRFAEWHIAGRSPRILYSADVLGGIAAEAVSGYARYAWGGVEIGGILFGEESGGTVRILASQPIACEHANGPSFELSAGEVEQVRAQLERSSPELEGLVPVGWYHTVSHRDLTLTDCDLDFYNAVFPGASQIALVIKRSKHDAPRFAFFFRDADASVQTYGSLKEFSVTAPDGVEEDSAVRAVEPGRVEMEPEPLTAQTIAAGHEAPLTAAAAEPERDAALPERDVLDGAAPAGIEPGPAGVQPMAAQQITSITAAAAAPQLEIVLTQPRLGDAASFFGFHADPFAPSPDPAFLFAARDHREAIASLVYAVQWRKGFGLLTGPVGTGKTLVLNCVMQALSDHGVQYAFVFNAKLTSGEFFELLAVDLGLDCRSSKTAVLFALNDRLIQLLLQGTTAALIVDDAHKLTPDVLEEIELLGNLENRRGRLLQVIFAAQPEFEELLNKPRFRGLRQKIVHRSRLEPFSEDDTAKYVEHRLKQAGSSGLTAFSPGILRMVHQRTRGVPRLINALCAKSLERAARDGVRSLTPATIEEACRELCLDPETLA